MNNNTGIASKVYSVAATCSNCGHKGSVTRPKGHEMPTKDRCPNCDCWTFYVQSIFGS